MIFMIILSLALLGGLYAGRQMLLFIDREDAAYGSSRK